MSSFDYQPSLYPTPHSYESALSPSSGTDKELQTFLQMMQQRAEFQNQVGRLTSICWEKCATGYPSAKMDAKKNYCLENCAERYLDVSILLRTRFQSMLGNMQQQQLD